MYGEQQSAASSSTGGETLSSLTKRRGAIIGCALSLGSVTSGQIMARAGFEWAFIDMEHAPTSPREATSLTHAVVAASGGRCLPIVRVPAHGVEWIKWALDSGAAGIIVPMVNTGKQAEEIIDRAIYPPHGSRSFGPFQAPFADTDPTSDVARYITQRVKDVAVILMIESVQGVENAREILSVKGVSGCFIGPFDLRQSLGLPGGDGEEPKFINALEKVLSICKELGLHTGTVASSEAAVKRKTEMGFDFLLAGGDTGFLDAKARTMVAEFERGVKTAGKSNL